MKHCAKKLLGLAFALALCLAVGGTALAQTPEFADVPAALPEQEMLAYEPNVTTAGKTTTTGDLATDGYTVTIPTTVTVDSGTNTAELPVKAQLKQWRTLKIGIASDHNWNLQNESGQAQAGYSLTADPKGSTNDGKGQWFYNKDETGTGTNKPTLSLAVGQKPEGVSDITWAEDFTIPMTVNVTDLSKATMSGTYSDRLVFTFNITKQSVTYTINVYGQNITAKADGRAGVESVVTPGRTTDGSTRTEGTVDASKVKENTYTETYTMEYGFAGDKLAGAAPGPWTHTQPEPGDTRTSIKNTVTDFTPESAADYKRCWETLSQQTIDPQTDYTKGIRNVTINLNLVRKWYWLDVNGIIDYDGSETHKTHGNQGGEKIGCYLDVRISPDNTDWSSQWYRYGSGDDYWERLPYGTYVQVGFHSLKDGYIYDVNTDGNIKVIANGDVKYTTKNETVGSKEYKIFEGQLKGEPLEKNSSNLRYCFNVCYHKAITYYANNGTDAKKSFEYDGTQFLPLKEEVDSSWTNESGATFVGWSTKRTISSDSELLHPNEKLLSDITWPSGNTRTLYAQWQYSYTVKLSFESKGGWTNRNPKTGAFGTEQSYTADFHNEVVDAGTISAVPGQSLTFSADSSDKTMWDNIQKQIELQTAKTPGASGKLGSEIWQLSDAYTVKMPTNNTREAVIVIKRQRYLVNVIAVLVDNDGKIVGDVNGINAANYGEFDIWVNGHSQTAGHKRSIYQYKRNFGSSYRVEGAEGKTGYQFYGFRIVNGDGSTTDKLAQDKKFSYEGVLTGKSHDITYFGWVSGTDPNHYTGDTIYVMFKKNPGSKRAPAKKALTLRYHANFDPTEELALDLDPNPLLEDMDEAFGFDPDPLPEDEDDALEEAVKTVTYRPGENVVLRNCMFKRGGYVFVGWNTEPDGTGKLYRVNGVPITDWAAGDTVDLYAQWKKPEHLKPVVDNEPLPEKPDAAAPAAPPERVDDGFDAAFGVDPAAQPDALDALDDSFSV